MHYFNWNIKSYVAATVHLSNSEDLAYRRLLDHYYDTEFPIPTALPVVCRRLRLDLTDVEMVLNEFFILKDDGWHNQYCDEEISKYKAFINRQKENGSKGGRGNKPDAKPIEPSALQNEPIAKPTKNKELLTNNHKPLTNKIKSIVSPSGETVEVFDYWKSVMNHPAAQLDAKRTKTIKSRLSDGYTVAQLCSAVDGCKYDPFSQGSNDRKTIYDDIELICRDGPKVDKFISIASRGPQRQSTLGEAGQATASAAEEWIRSRNAGRN